MLIVAGWIDVDPDERDAYVAARLDRMRAARAEAGCVDFVFSPDPIDSGRIRLFERWEQQRDLDAHRENMRSAPPIENEPPVLAREIAVYDVASTGPLG